MTRVCSVQIFSRDAGDLIGDASIRDLLLGKAVKFVDRGVDSKGSPVKIHYALLGADKHGDGCGVPVCMLFFICIMLWETACAYLYQLHCIRAGAET